MQHNCTYDSMKTDKPLRVFLSILHLLKSKSKITIGKYLKNPCFNNTKIQSSHVDVRWFSMVWYAGASQSWWSLGYTSFLFAPAVPLRAQPLSRQAHRRSLESVLPSPWDPEQIWSYNVNMIRNFISDGDNILPHYKTPWISNNQNNWHLDITIKTMKKVHLWNLQL